MSFLVRVVYGEALLLIKADWKAVRLLIFGGENWSTVYWEPNNVKYAR